MKSKQKALSKVSQQQKKDDSAKPSSKEWRGGKEKHEIGEGMKCSNCDSMKHMSNDCPYDIEK